MNSKYPIGIALSILGLTIAFNGAFIGGMMILLVGISIIPYVAEKNKEKYAFWRNSILRRSALGILLLVGVLISFNQMTKEPQTETTSEIKDDNTPQSEHSRKTPKIINLDNKYFDENGNEVVPDSNSITYKVLEVLDHLKNEARESENNWENLSLLVEVNNTEKEALHGIITQIKKEYVTFAPNNCNIDLWDNRDAYKLYLERDKQFGEIADDLMAKFQKTRKPIGDEMQALQNKWDRKNYPFIAEHLIATITLGNDYSHYMLKDSHYEEMSKEK